MYFKSLHITFYGLFSRPILWMKKKFVRSILKTEAIQPTSRSQQMTFSVIFMDVFSSVVSHNPSSWGKLSPNVMR